MLGRFVAMLVAFVAMTATAYAAAPQTILDMVPSSPDNDATPTFTFHAEPAAGATFECRRDLGAFTSCSSPHTTSALSEGSHTFYVRATSGGETDSTPDSHTWTVDLTPPSTQVTSHPPTLTNSGAATFEFTSPDASATFSCSLNGAAPEPCESPVQYVGLSDATRTMLIRAVDPAGNVDTQAATITWTVDGTPPDTSITGSPPAINPGEFAFTASEPGTFQCAFDGGAFAACTSPAGTSGVPDGNHTFRVRGVDGAGNVDATPATRTFTRDLTGPAQPGVAIVMPPRRSGARASAGSPVFKTPTGVMKIAPVKFAQPKVLPVTQPFILSTRLRAFWRPASQDTVDFTVQVRSFDAASLRPEPGTGQTLTHTKAMAANLTTKAGRIICVRVRAFDAHGNASVPRTTCTTIPYGWQPGAGVVPGPKYWQGRAYISAFPMSYRLGGPISPPHIVFNQSVYFRPPVEKLAVVVTKCPTCGRLRYGYKYIESTRVISDGGGVVNLHSGTVKHGVLLRINIPPERRNGKLYVGRADPPNGKIVPIEGAGSRPVTLPPITD